MRSAAFLCGVLAILLDPSPPPHWLAAALCAALSLIAPRRTRSLGFAAAGALLALLSLQAHFAGLQTGDERLLVEAQIVGIPRLTATGRQFDARLTFPRDPGRPSQQARLSWRGTDAFALSAGERWQFAVRLRSPRGAVNPGSVDMERNYLRDHVQATGTVIASALNRRTAAAGRFSLLALRARLADAIDRRVVDPASAALLAALAVGATGDVSRDQWRVFNATGITHLVAISGLHVTLFAVIAMALARRAWGLAARCGLTARRDRVAAVCGLSLATGYALLAGFSVPTQRTLLMLGVWMLWRECGRVSTPMASVGAATVAVILMDPFCVLSAGFWLSFAAVAAIIGFEGGHLLPQPALHAAMRVQWLVSIALLPVTLAIFGSMSLAGLLVNIAAIPAFSFVLVPLVLAATAVLLCLPAAAGAFIGGKLLDLAGLAADLMWPALVSVADFPGALWQAVPMPGWFALAAIAVLLALLPWPPALRVTSLLCLLPLFAVRSTLAGDQWRATLLDTGQSMAVLIETAQHALLYDTGVSHGSSGAAVEQSVVPHARFRRVRAIDRLLLSRFDVAASDGYFALQGLMPARRVAASAAGARDGLPPEVADCGQERHWEWNGVGFEILQQAPDDAGATPCMLEVTSPGGSLLVATRVTPALARSLLARGLPPMTVVMAAKQSAGGVALRGLLQELRPQWVLSSSAPATGDRDGLRWLDTASCGSLTVTFTHGTAPVLEAARRGRLGAWSRRDFCPG